MIQLALGVVDAVPPDRRARLAQERLLFLSSEHRFARRRATRLDVLAEAAAEVIANVDRLYYEGRLDYLLCGLAVADPASDPVTLLETIASPLALDIGPNNYRALVTTCLDALVGWAQAHPNLDTRAESWGAKVSPEVASGHA